MGDRVAQGRACQCKWHSRELMHVACQRDGTGYTALLLLVTAQEMNPAVSMSCECCQ